MSPFGRFFIEVNVSKKYLRKNEFRMDINPKHFGEGKKPHPAYITAKYKHKFKANSITHARKTTDGVDTHLICENPDKLSKDKRQTRVGVPFWQKEELFGKDKLKNFKFSKKSRIEIKKFNKKFK